MPALGALLLALGLPLPRLTPDLRDGQDHGVRIAVSPGKGFGAFTSRLFAARETVDEPGGPRRARSAKIISSRSVFIASEVSEQDRAVNWSNLVVSRRVWIGHEAG